MPVNSYQLPVTSCQAPHPSCPSTRTAGPTPLCHFVGALLLVLWGCGGSRVEEYLFQGPTMGTAFSVKVVAQSLSEESQEEIRRSIEAALAQVDAKMSTYQPDSELSRFNRLQETAPFPLSPETFEVFRLAQQVSRASGGAFDITVGPAVDAWGFGPEATVLRPPGREELAKLQGRIGFHHLELDPESSTVRKGVAELRCDLSGIAKGYGVDRVAEALDGGGLTDYMIEVGGEVRTRGRNARHQPWQVAIERPEAGERRIHSIVPLSGLSLATSGDYRNFFERNGVRFSHTIDPRTARPVLHRLASVSVVHPRCAFADAFATALMVLGPEDGYTVALDGNLAALFLVHAEQGGFQERATPAFVELMEVVEVPG